MKVTNAAILRIAKLSGAERFALFLKSVDINFTALLIKVRAMADSPDDYTRIMIQEIEEDAILFEAKQRFPAATVGPFMINPSILTQ